METFANVIHFYATVLPYAMPIILAYLYTLHKKEKKNRKERTEAYARYYGIPVRTAKKILYPTN